MGFDANQVSHPVSYAWKGRNARGELVNGKILAKTEREVVDQLLSMDVTPILIEVGNGKEKDRNLNGFWSRLTERAIDANDIMTFSRQMYTLTKAGVPILRAFAGLESTATKPEMTALIGDIRSSLDQGRELSVALARHEKIFGAFYISMIRVGEMTGRLTEVFLRLNEHLEFERDVRERVKQAMRYPAFVLIAIFGAVVILNIFVIPTFAKVFDSFNAPLPVITVGLINFSSWMVDWWPMLIALCFGTYFGISTYLATHQGRYRWDRQKLSLPIIGRIILKSTLARFARSFALSNQSGVPMVQAMTVVAKTVDNVYIGDRIDQMRDGIERGDSISRCAQAVGIFPLNVIQMITIGEETGELDRMLFEVAEMYERETGYEIKGLSAAIEPVLLAVIGTMVLILALGIFLPLWNLGQVAMGKG